MILLGLRQATLFTTVILGVTAPLYSAETVLPMKGTAANPALYLKLGRRAVSEDAAIAVSRGEVVGTPNAHTIAEAEDSVNALHKGLGEWGANFRFPLASVPLPGAYTFWANWQQGGEPGYCPQTYSVLAGPDAERLEERVSFRLTNFFPWKFMWINGATALLLKATDRVIEVRNVGKAQDAKMFNAFLLVPGNPPPPDTAKLSGDVNVKTTGHQREPGFLQKLPTKCILMKPQILLQLGAAPASVPASDQGLTVIAGAEVISHEGDRGIEVNAEEVQSLRAGTDKWSTHFRFTLPKDHPVGDLTFWARWRQGGDPRTSAQHFELWAGADKERMELRGTSTLTPDGWSFVWRPGKQIQIKPEDRLIEVRNTGHGQTAKIFSAFLLGGPKPPLELPLQGTPEKPVVVLGFGKNPLGRTSSDACTLVYSGSVSAGEGADKANTSGEMAFVYRKGFGAWGATFQFGLEQPIPPGYYRFHARYMSGGEVSQVRQTFTIKAGSTPQNLGVRGIFQTLNNTPFSHQWLEGKGAFTLFPGDTLLQIEVTGKAHDVKVFHGFALSMENALPAWLSPEKAAVRSAFLSRGGKAAQPEKHLYVVDGPGPGDATLFAGLANEKARAWYHNVEVKYLLGEEAIAMSQRLNLRDTPAAVVVNTDRRVLGVLSNPKDSEEVLKFLEAPNRFGCIPQYAEEQIPAASVLTKNGSPAQWLAGVNWPGQNGVGRWGVGAEAAQRPNPGDLIAYGYYTAGNRKGTWTARDVDIHGVCMLTQQLEDSYAWGKACNYAVLYFHAEAPMTTLLHFQHTGIRSAVYLDGIEQQKTEDAAAFMLGKPERTAKEVTAERAGQEIHDDVAELQNTEKPLVSRLSLDKGWHCLIVKLVHGQGKGECVRFSGTFMDESHTVPTGIRTHVYDPEVAASPARAAAGLWPSLTLAGIPGNLPRPGETLTLIADIRVTPSFLDKWCPDVFLPIHATLRVRMTDYDEKEIKRVECTGIFPSVATLNLGPAPEAGYYILIPELVAADGRLLHRFYPDGFSVVRGNEEQKARVGKKELMNSWYYAFNDWETFAPWLERIGMFKNVGSTPGTSGTDCAAKWADAQQRGILLFGDFAGDSNWMNNDAKMAEGMVAIASKYTRYFKGINEIDGRFSGSEGAAWHLSRNPEKYVERAQQQHEAVHKARPDALHFGGSVYTSGNSRSRADRPDILGPREWLRKCLELGLDKYIDAWDVHAYPQQPPVLEAPSVSNSSKESDLGVRDVYREVGIPFTKPFLLGETSAMVFHGFTALRWQADTVAKLTAWTNSREDWLGVALCAAHHDRRKTAEEYAMARNPGEAAIYTAGALIDGLPYKREPTNDKAVQAAWFGDTFMIWRTDDKASMWKMPLTGEGPWVSVDVVGRLRLLEVKDGQVSFMIGTSPVYVLSQANYERLTR